MIVTLKPQIMAKCRLSAELRTARYRDAGVKHKGQSLTANTEVTGYTSIAAEFVLHIPFGLSFDFELDGTREIGPDPGYDCRTPFADLECRLVSKSFHRLIYPAPPVKTLHWCGIVQVLMHAYDTYELVGGLWLKEFAYHKREELLKAKDKEDELCWLVQPYKLTPWDEFFAQVLDPKLKQQAIAAIPAPRACSTLHSVGLPRALASTVSVNSSSWRLP